jgi:excisionase family DNA binding protein
LQTLTIKQAAELKAVSTKTIRRWIALGLLPAERLGPRLIRIRHDDLEAVGRRIPAAS